MPKKTLMGAKLLKTIPSFQGHDGWVDARETVLVERGFFFSFFLNPIIGIVGKGLWGPLSYFWSLLFVAAIEPLRNFWELIVSTQNGKQ